MKKLRNGESKKLPAKYSFDRKMIDDFCKIVAVHTTDGSGEIYITFYSENSEFNVVMDDVTSSIFIEMLQRFNDIIPTSK